MARKGKILRFGIRFLSWIVLTIILLFIVYDNNTPFLPQFIATLVVTGFTALPAYLSSKELVPRFLYHKAMGKFIGSSVLVVFINTILTFFIGGSIYYGLSGKSILRSTSVILLMLAAFFIINSIVVVVSSAIRIIVDRFNIEKQLHVVEDEKVSTELAFLRAQINPHFLFNVLNTIYFQINKENREARNSVEKLSEMLRYQLYDCTTDMIDISKELAYIESYVAVQRLRMEAGTDLQLQISENMGNFKIAPLLILPLVENAFKHLSNFKDPTKNKLNIHIFSSEECPFIVSIVNTYNPLEGYLIEQKQGGVGLKNLERRLVLLYPGNHSLTQKRNLNTYETILKIQYCDKLPCS